MTTQLTGRAANRSQIAIAAHQDKLRQLDYLRGKLTVSEAAGMVQRTRQAVLKAITTGALPAVRGPKGREWWIDPSDLTQAFPAATRAPGARRPWTRRMTRQDHAQVYPDLIQPGSPEWEASKKRMVKR